MIQQCAGVGQGCRVLGGRGGHYAGQGRAHDVVGGHGELGHYERRLGLVLRRVAVRKLDVVSVGATHRPPVLCGGKVQHVPQRALAGAKAKGAGGVIKLFVAGRKQALAKPRPRENKDE